MSGFCFSDRSCHVLLILLQPPMHSHTPYDGSQYLVKVTSGKGTAILTVLLFAHLSSHFDHSVTQPRQRGSHTSPLRSLPSRSFSHSTPILLHFTFSTSWGLICNDCLWETYSVGHMFLSPLHLGVLICLRIWPKKKKKCDQCVVSRSTAS